MDKNSETYMLGYSDGAEMFEMTWEKELEIVPRFKIYDRWYEGKYELCYSDYKPLITWLKENLNWKKIGGQEYASGYFQALSDRFQYSKNTVRIIDDVVNKKDPETQKRNIEEIEIDPEKLSAACEKAVSDMLKVIEEIESAGGIKN